MIQAARDSSESQVAQDSCASQAAQAVLGKVGKFDETKEDWPQYVEWLGHFFVANGIEESKKRFIFLTAVVTTVFKLLRYLVSPAKPGKKTYDDLVKLPTEHYKPTPL